MAAGFIWDFSYPQYTEMAILRWLENLLFYENTVSDPL